MRIEPEIDTAWAQKENVILARRRKSFSVINLSWNSEELDDGMCDKKWVRKTIKVDQEYCPKTWLVLGDSGNQNLVKNLVPTKQCDQKKFANCL